MDTHSSPLPRNAGPSVTADEIIGRELARRRKAACISRANFAALLGVTQHKLRDVEAGRARLDPAAFLRAAQILAVRPSDIFRNVTSAFTADLASLQSPEPGHKEMGGYAELRLRLERIMDKCDDILRLIDLIDADGSP